MKIFKLILVSLFHLLWYQNTTLVAAKEHHHDVTTTRNHDLTSNKDIQEVEEQHEMKEKDDQLLVLSSRKGRRSLRKRKSSSSFVNETRSDSFQSYHRSLGDAPVADRKRWQKIWEDIANKSRGDVMSTRKGAINLQLISSDTFRVKLKDDICYIFADNSNDILDWINNFSYGTSDIEDSGYTTTIRYRKWEWVSKGWWGYYIYTRKTKTETILDQGYTGFVIPFNKVSSDIKDIVEDKCSGATQYIYTGYSRGGALAQLMALHHFRNGLFNNVEKVSLVVFSSPNALAGWSANALKDNLDEAVNTIRYKVKSVMGKYIKKYDIIRGKPPGFVSAADEKEVECRNKVNNVLYSESELDTPGDIHRICRGYDMIFEGEE